MKRRDFINNIKLAGTASLILPCSLLGNGHSTKAINTGHSMVPISKVKKPLAIAMWDYSWILRHHRYGEFFDWDMVLEGLAERGYDAIRIDVMPQFVASSKEGKIVEEYRTPKKDWVPILWGNDYTMDFRPREALLEFLPKCKKNGIKVGLATWFGDHGIGIDIGNEEGGLIRAWKETLDFLKKNNLLDDNIIYVDLLNEYPYSHGYKWLKIQLNKCLDAEKLLVDNPQPNLNLQNEGKGRENSLYVAFYNDFANNLIATLKQEYPDLVFFTSFDFNLHLIDFKNQGALDYHIWFNKYKGISSLVNEGGSTKIA